jgi:hypothetical protein
MQCCMLEGRHSNTQIPPKHLPSCTTAAHTAHATLTAHRHLRTPQTLLHPSRRPCHCCKCPLVYKHHVHPVLSSSTPFFQRQLPGRCTSRLPAINTCSAPLSRNCIETTGHAQALDHPRQQRSGNSCTRDSPTQQDMHAPALPSKCASVNISSCCCLAVSQA